MTVPEFAPERPSEVYGHSVPQFVTLFSFRKYLLVTGRYFPPVVMCMARASESMEWGRLREE